MLIPEAKGDAFHLELYTVHFSQSSSVRRRRWAEFQADLQAALGLEECSRLLHIVILGVQLHFAKAELDAEDSKQARVR